MPSRTGRLRQPLMNLSRPFIERPVATTLLSLGIALAGIFAFARLRDRRVRSGMSPRDAIYHASLMRFRPIMMTTCAALLGALPLALGSSEGADLRRPLGISIVGGLIVSQILTLYTTPVVYLYVDRLGVWLRSRFARRALQ